MHLPHYSDARRELATGRSEVNNADVICGKIQTANATVYIINKVLIPMH